MESLRDLIARHEGKRLKVYFCPAGHHTIGYGHNIDAHGLPDEMASYLRLHGEITEEMAEQLLDRAIEAATWQCRDLFPGFDGFSEARRFALVDFCYNIGAGGIRKFKKALAAISEKRWNDAADEIQDSKYFTQVGERAREIVAMIRQG